MKKDNLNRTLYFSPEVLVIEVINEGVFCISNGDDFTEQLNENIGNWGQ